MKNSNIQWIGEIPDDWEVLKNKYNFELSKEIVGVKSASTQLLSLTKNGIKAITEDQQNGKVPASFNTYQVVKKDDIVMCLFDLDVSAVFSGISNYDGMISPAYKCFKCKPHLNPKYVDYYFRAVFVDRKYKRYSKNVRYSISAEEFMTLPILVPPLATQTSIADYLDAKCSEIDGLIADINKQIETLNELEKSTITEAVTKGLNKNAKLKDSGIQWIGEIPEHWRVIKTGYLFKEEVRRSNDSDIPLSLSQADGLIATDEMKENSLKTASYEGWKKVLIGDLVLNRFKAHLGVMFAATIEGKVSFHYGVFKQQRPLVSKYYEFLYHTNAYKTIYAGLSNGMTVGLQNLSNQNFYSAKSLYPPLAEQQAIATYLDTKCTEFDSIISDKQKQISTLEAYKKSLIYEYVTGKNRWNKKISPPA